MIVEASDERFAFAALQAVKKWRFRSGKKSGRDSACMVAVPIAFRLASR
jgi:outer membrane biosynthesis protein TonB